MEDWAQPTLSPAEYRRRARRYRFRAASRAIGFLAPYVTIWIVFLAIPVAWGVFLSFNEGGIVGPREFVGFENWTRALSDSELRRAVVNTAIFVVIAIAVVFTLAIFLASLLNKHRRGGNFFKVALYFPLLAPPILAAMIWHFLIHFDFGVLNVMQRFFLRGTGINFLGNNPNALLTIVAVEVWRGLGFWVLFYLAGLQSVPEELLDAARIDGARKTRRFLKITVPTLRPLLLFALVIAVIFNFQVFDTVQVLTDGGPALGTATVVWFIFKRMFAFQDTGLAFAASVGLLIVIMIMTAISFWALGKRKAREA
jgi:multiple sugar transport system permease protein